MERPDASYERQSVEALKFPIGPFGRKQSYTTGELDQFISKIEAAPELYRGITENLTDAELNKTYRSGSWNVRQLVHHVADIQMLHFLRMKKALTEPEGETIVILMDDWAVTADAKSAPVADSLRMLEGITQRYVFLMRTLQPSQLQIKYFHPVRGYEITQQQAIAMSAWHLEHHLAHIQIALQTFE